jgi:hypothetical protein
MPTTIGRYLVRHRLGEGGMGVVYEALDPQRGEVVALKTLAGATPNARWRFKREFRGLADLAHPNLVRLHELFAVGEHLYLAMELVDGVELQDWTWVRDAPDHTRIREVLRQLAHGVGALHAAGKLHLDIKPSNVMVTREGRVVLLDFGMVEEVASELTYAAKRRMLGGTPVYMAPEQIEAQPPTTAADCYAIGVLLFEVLTGRVPFEEDTLVDVLKAKRERDAERPAAIVAGVPDDLDELAVRLLDRDPARRAGLSDILALVEPRPVPAPRRPSAPEIRGRREPAEALALALADARGSTPVVVHVEGEAGVGKTALIRTFLREARTERGAVVLETRCYQRDALPLKVVDGLVDALVAYLRSRSSAQVDALLPRHLPALVRVFPVLERVDAVGRAVGRMDDGLDPVTVRTRAFAALAELLLRISERRPLVLFIDDLQWGDVESGWLLDDLTRESGAAGMICICAFRTGETASSPVLRELSAQHQSGARRSVRTIRVERLGFDEAKAVARERLAEAGSADIQLAAAVAREADGNPLFIEELARHYAARPGGPATVGLGFDDVVRARVDALPAAAADLVRLVAVAGHPLPADQALAALGDARVAEGTLAELAGAHLLRRLGGAEERLVECFHGRIRDAILGGLGEVRVRELHARWADVLQRAGGSRERLTAHLLAAGRGREAGETALLAATDAERALAFERAAALYAVALRHLEMSEVRRRELETRRAGALAGAGKVSSAAGLYLQRQPAIHPELLVRRRRLAAEKLLRTGHLEEGSAVLRSVLAAVDLPLPVDGPWGRLRRVVAVLAAPRRVLSPAAPAGTPDTDRTARVDAAFAAATGLGLLDPGYGIEMASRHVALALRTCDATRIACGAALLGERSAAAGDPRGSARRLDDAEAIAATLDDPFTEAFVAAMRGLVHLQNGDFEGAIEVLGRADTGLEGSGREHAWESGIVRGAALVAKAELGQLAEVVVGVPRILEEARGAEDRLPLVLVGSRIGHLPGLVGDDAAAATRMLDRVAKVLPRGPAIEPHGWLLSARVQVAHYQGDWDGAGRLLARELPRLEQGRRLRSPSLRAALARDRASTALGQAANGSGVAGNLRCARASIATLARSRRACDRAWADLLAAEVAVLRGEGRLHEAFAAAAERLAAAGCRVASAAATVRAGQVLPAGLGAAVRAEVLEAWGADRPRAPFRFLRVFSPGIKEPQGRS